MKTKKAILLGAVAASMILTTARVGVAGPVCVTVVSGYTLMLSALPKSTKSKLITGHFVNDTITFVGAGFVNGNGDRIVGVTEMWSTAGYDPVGIATINLPADMTVGTSTYSYSGNDVSPTEASGAAAIVDCP